MSSIKPFLPSRPSGIVFIGLNILRVLSIIALTLVFSANIVTMVKSVDLRIRAPCKGTCMLTGKGYQSDKEPRYGK